MRAWRLRLALRDARSVARYASCMDRGRLKKGTVRAQGQVDAAALRERFSLKE